MYRIKGIIIVIIIMMMMIMIIIITIIVPHSWIIESLDLFGVAENIKSLLMNSMEK